MNRNRPDTAAALHRFYVAARSHFGYTDRWWPGSPVELTVTAILVQQCDWTVAWKAAKRLRDAELLNLSQRGSFNHWLLGFQARHAQSCGPAR